MSDRYQLIDRLQKNRDSRAAYIRGKLGVLVSSQLHALRLKREWTQKQFAQEADMRQSRVSAMEQPGAVNFNLETLVRVAAVHGLGLQVKFVSFNEMLEWENKFNQDEFAPITIANDAAFLNPVPSRVYRLQNVFINTNIRQTEQQPLLLSAEASLEQQLQPHVTLSAIPSIPSEEAPASAYVLTAGDSKSISWMVPTNA